MTVRLTRELLEAHHAYVESDNKFQARLRLLQALWREEQGLPVGLNRGRPQGAWVAMPYAKDTLCNYMTESVREIVRAEVLNPIKSRGKMYAKPRIFSNLLSSQPLCFNLFGELQRDLNLATRALTHLIGGRIRKTNRIEFEHSPGRGDPRFTGDNSAFDVYAEYTSNQGRTGFIGIEVKYHEALNVDEADHRSRYDEVSRAMGCFKPECEHLLRQRPLEQLWRDHLLAGSLLLDRASGFDEGMCVFLAPKDNPQCSDAVTRYRLCLTDDSTFTPWTLECLIDAIRAAGAGPWIEAVRGRYLGFEKLDTL